MVENGLEAYFLRTEPQASSLDSRKLPSGVIPVDWPFPTGKMRWFDIPARAARFGKIVREIKPDVIHLSSCMVNAKPECPYTTPDEKVQILEGKTGIKVIQGTHDYH